MVDNKLLATLSIHEAVRQTGGNGLSSPAFQPPLNFLFVFSWVNVEQGVEALICNGELLTRTKLKPDFLRIMGKRSFFHRVLMKPEPLEVKVQSFSKDQLKVDLIVSIKYEVIDPFYVASTQDPMLELSNLMIGVIGECIRGYDTSTLLGEDSGINESIKAKLIRSPIVNNHFDIIEILKVIPLIDERLISIKNRTREAFLEKDLIDAEGINRQVKAEHDLVIARNEEMLNEEIKQREHDRKLEEMQIQERASITKEAIKVLGTIGGSGIDPSKVAQVMINSMVTPVQSRNIGSRNGSGIIPPKLEDVTIEKEKVKNQFDKEFQALQSIKERLGIVSIQIIPSGVGINGAIIQFADYEIVFQCPPLYPDEKPEAVIRYSDGTEKLPEDFWVEGVTNLIAQAVMVLVHKA